MMASSSHTVSETSWPKGSMTQLPPRQAMSGRAAISAVPLTVWG